MYEYLKKVQALAEEIGPVTSVSYNHYRSGYIEVTGEFKDGHKFELAMTITEKEPANE